MTLDLDEEENGIYERIICRHRNMEVYKRWKSIQEDLVEAYVQWDRLASRLERVSIPKLVSDLIIILNGPYQMKVCL